MTLERPGIATDSFYTLFDLYMHRRDFARLSTTLKSMMCAKLSLNRFWPCHENGLIKTIQTTPCNLYESVKSDSFYCGLG